MDPETIAETIQTVLRGFEEGVFVRDTSRDTESDWAIKAFPFLRALGQLKEYADKCPDPLHLTPADRKLLTGCFIVAWECPTCGG